MPEEKINQVTDKGWIAFLEFFLSSALIAGIWIAIAFWAMNLDLVMKIIFLVLASLLTLLVASIWLISLVRFYRLFAPESLHQRCRYTPTCSIYMIVSLRKYGAIVGLIRGMRRIIRCHPPYGGIDNP